MWRRFLEQREGDTVKSIAGCERTKCSAYKKVGTDALRVPTQLNHQTTVAAMVRRRKSSGDLVIACCYAAEVLEARERPLDQIAADRWSCVGVRRRFVKQDE